MSYIDETHCIGVFVFISACRVCVFAIINYTNLIMYSEIFFFWSWYALLESDQINAETKNFRAIFENFMIPTHVFQKLYQERRRIRKKWRHGLRGGVKSFVTTVQKADEGGEKCSKLSDVIYGHPLM